MADILSVSGKRVYTTRKFLSNGDVEYMKQLFIDRKLWARRVFLVCYDICAVFIAALLALIARFDFSFDEVPEHFLENMWKSMPPQSLQRSLFLEFSVCTAAFGVMQGEWR